MAEHEAARAASEGSANLWTFLGTVGGGIGAFIGKHLWDRKKSAGPGIRELLEEMSKEMAVMKATMATKEDLNEAVEKMADNSRLMVEAVHKRINDHLRDHSNAA
jgi:hypothetical protein